MRARLVSLSGHPTIGLSKTMTLVGRQDCCDVRIRSSRISRCHCCLVLEDGEVVVRDLNSTNGTHVNGLAVESSPLRHGDVLSIGPLKYRVVLEEAGREAASGHADPTDEAQAHELPTSFEMEYPELKDPSRESAGPPA